MAAPQESSNPFAPTGLENPIHALTDYELSNLVRHLVEIHDVDRVSKLLVLETSDARNAWYEAKLGASDRSGYVLDVEMAIRAVQAPPMGSDAQSAIAPRLGEEYRYALLLTSINSLTAEMPASVVAVLRRRHLISTTDALSYARRGPTALHRAEALTELLPALDRPDEQKGVAAELARELACSEPQVALAERSRLAELWAQLVPYADHAERARIIDDLIDWLEREKGTGDSYGLINAIRAVTRYLTSAQAERLLNLAVAIGHSTLQRDLLPAIGEAAGGK